MCRLLSKRNRSSLGFVQGNISSLVCRLLSKGSKIIMVSKE